SARREATGDRAAPARPSRSGPPLSARSTRASRSRPSLPRTRAASAADGSTGSRRYADRPVIEGKTVGVVVPAYQEEELLPSTLGGIPEFVDRIYVVDDGSPDGTVERARTAAAADPRISVTARERNGGVGAAVMTGYRQALEDGIDVAVVMNADNQMDPEDLEHLVVPVARGEVDYAKANRLFTGQAWQLIPHSRYLGNAVLSLWTKVASGYWHVADAQSGYTAIGKRRLGL